MSLYAAYLRVYEPLAAFSGAERARWGDYVAAGAAPDRAEGPRLEQRAALAALLGRPGRPVVAEADEHAFVRIVDGVTYVCPWRTRARSWAALAEFRALLPEDVAEAFVPSSVADTAAGELASWKSAHPDLRVPVASSSWHVPLRWFVLVEAAERQLILGHRHAGSARGGRPDAAEPRSLRYLTQMSRARRRAARALAVLRRTVDDGPVVSGIEELARWIEEFHPRSIVELDYGGLVHLVDDDALREDDSAADVAAALAGLAAGNPVAAAEAYRRVSIRWHATAMMESAN